MQTNATAFLFLLLAGCNAADASKTDASAASTKPVGGDATSKPASSATTKPSATEAPAAEGPPPADPLKDADSVGASCEAVKALGVCVENYNFGPDGESLKDFCEGPLFSGGKWTKGKACPKEGRSAVCRTDHERRIYYKKFYPNFSEATLVEICTQNSGKWGEFPNGK